VDRVVLAGRPEVVQTCAPSRVRGMTVALVTAIDRLF